jgi:hypothetical protein
MLIRRSENTVTDTADSVTKRIVRFEDWDEAERTRFRKQLADMGDVAFEAYVKHAVVEIAEDGGVTIFNSVEAQRLAGTPVKLTKPRF